MFNRCSLSAAVLSVLVSGCGSKKTEKDVYTSPPPKIVRQGEPLELKAWSADSAKSLDLQDEFDVSAGRPAAVQVTGHCLRGETAVSETVSFGPVDRIAVFKVIPREILVQRFEGGVNCNFDIVLNNEAGSKHIFTLPTASITENGPTRVQMVMRQDGMTINKTSMDLVVKQENFSGIELRRTELAGVAADVACADVTFAAKAFDRVIDLSEFDYATVKPRSGRAENILSSRAYQTCRILLLDDAGKVADIGPAFGIFFHVDRPAIELISAPYRQEALNTFDFQSVFVQNVQKGSAFEFSTLRISNPSPGTRYFRLARGPRFIQHSYYLTHITGGGPHMSKALVLIRGESAAMSIQVAAQNAATVSETDSTYEIVLPPGASIVLRGDYLPKIMPGCRAGVDGYAAASIRPETLHELTDQGVAANSYQFDWGPRQTFSGSPTFPAERTNLNPAIPNCSL